MIPLFESELVDRHHWVDRDEFLDMLALAQSMPGVLAVNMATIVGYRLRGVRGAMAAICGNIVFPILTILLLAICFRQFKDNAVVNHIFMGIRPAVVALIAAPVFNMARSAHISWSNCWIPILSALLIWWMGVSPVLVILGAALLGLLWGKLFIHK